MLVSVCAVLHVVSFVSVRGVASVCDLYVGARKCVSVSVCVCVSESERGKSNAN
jgi:hypothetical protein